VKLRFSEGKPAGRGETGLLWTLDNVESGRCSTHGQIRRNQFYNEKPEKPAQIVEI
jgi:hypothetical protein